MKCNQSRPAFELVSPCPFPTPITITPRDLIYGLFGVILEFRSRGTDRRYLRLLFLPFWGFMWISLGSGGNIVVDSLGFISSECISLIVFGTWATTFVPVVNYFQQEL